MGGFRLGVWDRLSMVRRLDEPFSGIAPRHLPDAFVFAVLLLAGLPAWAESVTFTVSETAGLRRFGYPVTASLECGKGALGSVEKARLVNDAGKEVPAQFTAMSTWPDGPVHGLDVDFVSSLGPMEEQTYRVEFGRGPSKPLRKRLEVTETPEEIVVASSAIRHRIRRDGKPLLTFIAFRENEFLGADGIRTTLAPGAVEVLKRGPFNVTLTMGAVRLEYVSTKSWVKITQRAEAVSDLAVDAQFNMTKLPLLWDFGVRSWLYGSLRKAGHSALLKHGRSGWQVLTARGAKPPSVYATGKVCEGWGHLADSERVAAFGMADCRPDDEAEFRLNTDGRVHIAAKKKELTVYFHLVGQPVAVTAATSPPSMLAPLRVTVQRAAP